MNFKQTISALAIATAGLSAGAVAGPTNIDLFDTDQAKLEDATTGDGGLTSSASTLGDDILGGERDIFVELLTKSASNPTATTSASVAGGAFSFSVDSLATGTATVQWDGLDGIGGHMTDNLDVTGLGGLDLSGSASFEITTLFSDLGWEFVIGAYTSATEWTQISFAASNYTSATTSTIPLAAFENGALCGAINPAPGVNSVTCGAGTVDWSNLGAMFFTIDPNGGTVSVDLTLDQVVTVPEPSTLGVLGLGLLALGASRRRKAAK